MKNLIAFGIICFASANLAAKDLYVVAATSPMYAPKFGSTIFKVADTVTARAEIFSKDDGNFINLINLQDGWLNSEWGSFGRSGSGEGQSKADLFQTFRQTGCRSLG